MTVGGLPPAKRYKGTPRRTVAATRTKGVANPRTGGFLGIETKFLDSGLVSSALSVSTAGAAGEKDPTTLNTICAIAQGDGESNRDGRTCMLKSVQVRGVIREPFLEAQTTPLNENGYFVAVVLDTQTNGAQLNSEDVFVNPSGSNICGDQPMRNLQFINRFIVLWSKHIERPDRQGVSWDATIGEYSASGVKFSMYKKLALPMHFTGTTAAIANIADNSLHVIAWARVTSALSPTISYNARVRFVG